MAQHIPIDENYVGDTDAETKAVRKIVDGVRYDINRSYTSLRGSLKWQPLSKEYCFNGSDAVFARSSNPKAPATMVVGGHVAIEVHMKEGKLFQIYMVA